MIKIDVQIGEVKNNCTVVGLDSNKSSRLAIVQCNICNKLLRVPVYNYTQGKFMCKHGRMLKAQDYLGTIVRNFKINSIEGKDETGRTLVSVTCTKCGSTYTALLYRVTSFTFICECEKRNKYEQLMQEKYKHYIGQTINEDKIIGLKYYKDNDSNNRNKFVLQCTKCGIQREVGVLTFLDSNSYKKCNCRSKTREVKDPMKKYNDTVLNKTFDNLKVVKLYDGTCLQNIIAVCECKCGNKNFTTMLSNIISGDTRSCGCKVKSHGEYVIEKTLLELGINFSTQQQLKDLISNKGRKLKFDFFIMDSGNIGRAVIEYDGPHHYMPFSYIGDYDNDDELIEAFEQMQINDKLKDEYVINHGCKILRIRYSRNKSDDNIKNEVRQFIESLYIDKLI